MKKQVKDKRLVRRTQRENRRDNLLGSRVQRARKTKNIKQSEMALRLGVSQSLYSAYETGARRINAEALIEISKILEMPIEQIIETQDNELNIADAETAAKAYEIALAMTQSDEENKKDAPAIQWAALGIDIANNLNETGQQLIKDYINVIRSNPLMNKE